MSVRLETVSFQIRTVVTVVSPLGLVMVTSFSCNHRSLEKSQRCHRNRIWNPHKLLKCPANLAKQLTLKNLSVDPFTPHRVCTGDCFC